MPGADRLPSLARFESFELDVRAGELRPRDGAPVRLPEQSLRILVLLLEHPGEVVQREEIQKRLWPNDTIVEFEHSISAAMNRLRQALGDSAEKPKYVETLARRGYRWMVAVEWAEGTAAPKPAAAAEKKPAESSDGRLIGKKVSHYRVLGILGGGGMGVVYEAEDLKLGRRVALKFLPEELGADPAALHRFESEARAASALNHPNICTIYGVEEFEGQPFLVMELLEGQTLRDLMVTIDPGKPALELTKLLDLAVQITAGLDAAHQQGIIHRDIKPANIFATSRGQAKILDFGLAKLLFTRATAAGSPAMEHRENDRPHEPKYETEALTASSPFLSRTGVAMGTAGYMSPEQVRGEKLDARTDLFSFGLVLYEMATGRQAFHGNTAAELHVAILNEAQPPARELNPGLPLELSEIIQRALKKNREARYSSASEMYADLRALAAHSPKQGTAAGEKSGSKLVSRLALVGAVLSLVVSGGVLWFFRGKTPPQTQLKQRQITTNVNESAVLFGAISPDGKYLAYSDAAGMYLKLMSTGEVRSLPTPEELRGHHVDWWLTWFPDGSRLVANASVIGRRDSSWTISVLGGQSRKLRDNAGAWPVSPNGAWIAFSTNPGPIDSDDREIWLMDTEGRNAHKILEAGQNNGFAMVDWSPDGKRLAYTKWQRGPEKTELVLESCELKGGLPTRIIPIQGEGEFKWLPGGRIIYVKSEPDLNLGRGDLWEQRVNHTTGEPRGKPQQLTHWAGFSINSLSATADGKQLAYRRVWAQRSVQVADLDAGPAHLSARKQLTHSEGNELPVAWTADSGSVLFVSNRSGPWGIFKQSLRDENPESIVSAALIDGFYPSVSLSGDWVLFVQAQKEGRFSQSRRLMRVPLAGGHPEVVLRGNLEGQGCARSPLTVCVFAERAPNRKQLVFSSFDPVNGRGKELARMEVDSIKDYDWDLSPDGSRIAIHKSTEAPIQIISIAGQATKQLNATGWNSIENLHWAADGKGLYSASRTVDSSVLLYLDLQGNTRVVWEQNGTMGNESAGTSGIPSPDGRHLAMMGYALNANMWMLEDF